MRRAESRPIKSTREEIRATTTSAETQGLGSAGKAFVYGVVWFAINQPAEGSISCDRLRILVDPRDHIRPRHRVTEMQPREIASFIVEILDGFLQNCLPCRSLKGLNEEMVYRPSGPPRVQHRVDNTSTLLKGDAIP